MWPTWLGIQLIKCALWSEPFGNCGLPKGGIVPEKLPHTQAVLREDCHSSYCPSLLFKTILWALNHEIGKLIKKLHEICFTARSYCTSFIYVTKTHIGCRGIGSLTICQTLSKTDFLGAFYYDCVPSFHLQLDHLNILWVLHIILYFDSYPVALIKVELFIYFMDYNAVNWRFSKETV